MLAAVREDEGSLKITQKGGEKTVIIIKWCLIIVDHESVTDALDFRLYFGSGWLRSNRPFFLGVTLPAGKPLAHVQGSEGILTNTSKGGFETQKLKITKVRNKISELK